MTEVQIALAIVAVTAILVILLRPHKCPACGSRQTIYAAVRDYTFCCRCGHFFDHITGHTR